MIRIFFVASELIHSNLLGGCMKVLKYISPNLALTISTRYLAVMDELITYSLVELA